MVSVKFLASAGAAVMLSSAAYAADLGGPPPAMQYMPPAPVAEQSAWYLRGDIGLGIASSSFDYIDNSSTVVVDQNSSNGDTVFVSGGIGYELNNWLRFDVTGEYRSKTDTYANIFYEQGGGTYGDTYHGLLNSWVVLANAYVDLGTWWCLTPFVGASVGGAYNTMDLTDTSIETFTHGASGGTGTASSWSLAWGLSAGLAYNVSDNFKVELAYRYLNYGSITDTVACLGGGCDAYKFGNLTSQDIMIGFRWLLQPEPTPVVMPQPPLSTRG